MLMASRSGRPCSAGVFSHRRTIHSGFPKLCEGRISRLRSSPQNAARNNERANAAAEEASDSHSSQPTHTHSEEEELWLGVMLIRFLMIACFIVFAFAFCKFHRE